MIRIWFEWEHIYICGVSNTLATIEDWGLKIVGNDDGNYDGDEWGDSDDDDEFDCEQLYMETIDLDDTVKDDDDDDDDKDEADDGDDDDENDW